jgi:hypothetical protein
MRTSTPLNLIVFKAFIPRHTRALPKYHAAKKLKIVKVTSLVYAYEFSSKVHPPPPKPNVN